MKKKIFKKAITVLLAVCLLAGTAACGQKDNSQDSKVSTDTQKEQSSEASAQQSTTEEETGITFPLKEEVTFDIMVANDGDPAEKLENNEWWQRLYEETNVKINFITLPSDNKMGVLNALFASGEEGDAIMGGSIINDADLSLMAGEGLLIPLNEYIDNPEIMPNFNERVLAESPNTKGLMTAPDGNIYSLIKYNAFEARYLESPILINKTWLDKAGLEIPKTIEDLEKALIAFRDGDMNGNGSKDDEVPYLLFSSNSASHIEAILGLWGIATKDSALDSYVYVKDGKVIFAPTTDAYKDAMKTLNRWYEEGLLWPELFTGTAETFNAKLNAQDASFGMITANTLPSAIEDQYVAIEPVAVEGYEPNWYIHPGLMGTKGMFSVTRSAENVDILMKWIDLFYSYESAVAINYGEEKDGRYSITDGKLVVNAISDEVRTELNEKAPVFQDVILNAPNAFTADDYANRIAMTSATEKQQSRYDVYKDYLTKEIWPRPYTSQEDASRLSELRTDIFNTVSLKRAEWIAGESDIDADWEEFKASLDKMGIDEFVEIMQKNYDTYRKGIQ